MKNLPRPNPGRQFPLRSGNRKGTGRAQEAKQADLYYQSGPSSSGRRPHLTAFSPFSPSSSFLFLPHPSIPASSRSIWASECCGQSVLGSIIPLLNSGMVLAFGRHAIPYPPPLPPPPPSSPSVLPQQESLVGPQEGRQSNPSCPGTALLSWGEHDAAVLDVHRWESFMIHVS